MHRNITSILFNIFEDFDAHTFRMSRIYTRTVYRNEYNIQKSEMHCKQTSNIAAPTISKSCTTNINMTNSNQRIKLYTNEEAMAAGVTKSPRNSLWGLQDSKTQIEMGSLFRAIAKKIPVRCSTIWHSLLSLQDSET